MLVNASAVRARASAPRALLPLPSGMQIEPALGVACLIGRMLEHPIAGDPRALGARADTHPLPGAPGRMASALNAMGLRWQHAGSGSLHALDRALASANYVAVRVRIGDHDHWIGVDGGSSHSVFSLTCPLVGRCHWRPSYLADVWAAAGHDYFVVPAHPHAHVAAYRPVHEMRFEDFIEHAVRVPLGQERPHELESVQSARAHLEAATVDPLQQIPFELSGLRFYRAADFSGHVVAQQGWRGVRGLLACAIEDPLQPIGAIHRGVPLVKEAFRRRGVGAAMILAAHHDGPHRYLSPTALSESGLGARVRAHALAIERAQAAGISVRPEVVASNPAIAPNTGHWPNARKAVAVSTVRHALPPPANQMRLSFEQLQPER